MVRKTVFMNNGTIICACVVNNLQLTFFHHVAAVSLSTDER